MRAIDAFRVFATGHFQTLWCARIFHALHGARRYVLDRDAATTKQIRRTWQDLHRRDAAGARGIKTGIMRPEPVLGPHLGRIRTGHFVAVRVRPHTGRSIHTKMRVIIDDSRCHPLARCIDHDCTLGCFYGCPDRNDFAVAHQNLALFDAATVTRQHRGILDKSYLRWKPLVG